MLSLHPRLGLRSPRPHEASARGGTLAWQLRERVSPGPVGREGRWPGLVAWRSMASSQRGLFLCTWGGRWNSSGSALSSLITYLPPCLRNGVFSQRFHSSTLQFFKPIALSDALISKCLLQLPTQTHFPSHPPGPYSVNRALRSGVGLLGVSPEKVMGSFPSLPLTNVCWQPLAVSVSRALGSKWGAK